MRRERVYDYIIVGAGSAGCVLASRLAEDPTITVLLLEAGASDRQPTIHIPAAFSKLFKSSCDWAYYTEAQSHLHQRRLFWPRGKVLGGSSSMNAMIYTRGNRYDYDRWRDLGNIGWSFSDVLPYFKKSEHQERGTSEYHGVGGPLNVSALRSINPLSHVFVEAGLEIGLHHNSDFNGPQQDGVGVFQVTQKHGKRHSTARAFLHLARKRRNLTVRTHACVSRLLFDNARAAGVLSVEDGRAHRLYVNREVILCAGVVNSPQLLLLSGIGPADHLKAMGIPVIVDLPGVGQNLQDHLVVGAVYACTQPVTMMGAGTVGEILRYLLFKTGPLTSNVAEAGAFVRTRTEILAPDLQLFFAPVFYVNHGFTHHEGHGFSILASFLRPQSHGRIILAANAPLEPPLIQPNYLSCDADLQALMEGLKLCRRLAQARAFDRFRGAEVYPSPTAQSDQAVGEYIRRMAESCYHPVGTCKMGKDPLAVVDPHLRVRGIEGLRVADASIMPTIVSGTTNAPTIMIAEKAADLLKEGPPCR
jgi:choline dehydrogenase-like flavoprotein